MFKSAYGVTPGRYAGLSRRLMATGVFASLRRHPSGALLAVQLVGLLLYPLMEDTGAGRALFNTFGVLVLALALWVVVRSPTANGSRGCWRLPRCCCPCWAAGAGSRSGSCGRNCWSARSTSTRRPA